MSEGLQVRALPVLSFSALTTGSESQPVPPVLPF